MSQDKVWWYAKEGKRVGPLSAVELKAIAVSGGLAPIDLVWKEGCQQWLSAASVKGLIPAQAPQMPPPLPPLISALPIEEEMPSQSPSKQASAVQSQGVTALHQTAIESPTMGLGNMLEERLRQIETMNIKESKKKIFRLITTNQIKQVFIGIPFFESKDKRLQPFKFNFAEDAIWNGWGLLTGFFYYFFTGMWKKGIILLLSNILLSISVSVLFGPKAGNAFGLTFTLFISQIANYDLYRKKVLNEEFWW